jgi:hypothetical protein
MMKKFSIILSLLVILSGCEDPSHSKAKIVWTSPTSGAVIDHYILEVDGGGLVVVYETTETQYTVELQYGFTYYMRVAGVGKDDAVGPYSELSNPFKFE